MGPKRSSEIDIFDEPSGGKLIRVTHPDGTISGFVKLFDSNRIEQLNIARDHE